MNPLTDFSGLPRFPDFEPGHVAPAVDELLAACRAAVERLTHPDVPATWDGFAQPLFDANERLGRAWGVVSHLNAVMNTPALREAYNGNLPRVTQYWTELGQNQALYQRFKALAASPEYAGLSPARRRIVDNELRDFRLGGAELADEPKARYAAVRERLAELTSRFSDNVLDATDAFAHFETDPARVAGIPADVLETAAAAAREAGREGWKFTLHMPSYMPVMQYADDRSLRELMYRAYSTRASELDHDAKFDNAPLIDEILALRAELASLVGFDTFARYSLEAKMATSPDEVLAFLRDLARRAKPWAERDVAELREFAAASLGLRAPEAWDIAYASEKLRIARYAFSDQEVKQYFPEDQVLAGLFGVIERLYGLQIRRDQAPVWHADARFYTIERDGGPIGHFYLDLYARPGKRGGAWMDEVMARRRVAGGIQRPVAYLICNFSGPVGDRPALFTHDDVLTLFHECGHGLHHLLTQVEDLPVSGINGVEWDAVELPSQFMENFCWEWEVVAPMTRHVDTGERFPRALFDRMLAARNFQAGMQTVRQIEFSLFDMLVHGDFRPGAALGVRELLAQVRAEVAVLVPPPFNRFANSFSHIFAGGYAAGYYSYKWAEVLSADAFSLFEETGVLDPGTGARFREEILAVGGSRPALESFVAFRGRPPSIDALLRHYGMSGEPAVAA